LRESQQNNSKDFVEIYHNSAAKSGSYSIVSSRQSKTRPVEVSHYDEEIPETISDNEQYKNTYSITEKSVDDLLHMTEVYAITNVSLKIVLKFFQFLTNFDKILGQKMKN
jgi:hypothetical protein